jgi:leucyl-tRNA synthetase
MSGKERVCNICGKEVEVGRIEKMSKSKKNVVDPNILLEKYGADTTRLFCLFAAPPERDLEWSEQGVEGGYRFLNRVWRLAATFMDSIKDVKPFEGRLEDLDGRLKGLYRKTHQTISKVTRDIEDRFHFNTAISAVMELYNSISTIKLKDNGPDSASVIRFAMESMVLLLAPMVPHFADEIWEAMGHESSVLLESWPAYKKDVLYEDEWLIVVQINGKLRSRFAVAVDTDEEIIKHMALSDERAKKFINNKPVKKVIVVKNKLVNIVV